MNGPTIASLVVLVVILAFVAIVFWLLPSR